MNPPCREKVSGGRVGLADIGPDNWEKVVLLRSESDYVASNAYSICQSVYEPGWTVKAITLEGEPVGFAMYGWCDDHKLWELCRFMVDARFQNRGIGRRALGLIVDEMRRDPACKDICLSTDPENARGFHLYQSFGFVDTGRMDEDGEEEIFVLKGGDGP